MATERKGVSEAEARHRKNEIKIGWVGAGSNTHALRLSGHPRKEYFACCGADHLGSLTQTPALAHSARDPNPDVPLVGQITCRSCIRSIKATGRTSK